MIKRLVVICGILILLGVLISACGGDTDTTQQTDTQQTDTQQTDTQHSDIVLTVTPAGQTATTFSYNFNPFASRFVFPTWSGIYEPLMINNRVAGELVPWLAEGYSWSEDLLTLTFTLREGVKWSDNTDFTSADVVYTFDLLKSTNGLGGQGANAVKEGAYVDSVTAPDALTVEFNFNEVNTAGFYDIIGQCIVPKHVWETIEDPRGDRNLTPVGTGPFTEVVDMQDQFYQIDRNPYYWQEGQPYVQGLRVVAFASNEAVATMLVDGTVDWSGQLIQNIDEAVVANNPDIGYWNAETSVQFFIVNTAIEPFDDPVVRKAISMSLDRERIVELASQPPHPIADITGMATGTSAAWKVDDPSTLGNWMDFNVSRANSMLAEAGYAMGTDGVRRNKSGDPLEFDLLLVNGFSDWIAIGPTIVANLEAIGFDVTVDNQDKGQWWDALTAGDYEMSMWFGSDADSPYTYYRNIMSTETVEPIGGTPGFGVNYWRVGIPEADDALLKFTSTGDLEVQQEAALELQQLFAEYAPVIPTWESGTTYVYSTAQVGGWANADDPFCRAMPIGGAGTFEQLIQMTSWGPAE